MTILHPQTWELLPQNIRQTLQASTKSIVAAEGTALKVVGSAEVVIRFGKLIKRHVIYVAPITQAGILGLDLLSFHEGILDIPKKKLRFGTYEIAVTLENEATSNCCRVLVAETVSIPSGQEVIVPGELHVRGTGITQGLIEPSGRFVAKDESMLIGRTFSSANNHKRVPVRVLNLKNEPSTIYKGTQVAILQPANEIQSEDQIDSVGDDLEPELEEMYQRCSEELTCEQKNKLKNMLMEHRDVFSKSGELGRTNVVYHSIDTGDARPKRQPARRLPNHQRAEAHKQVMTC